MNAAADNRAKAAGAARGTTPAASSASTAPSAAVPQRIASLLASGTEILYALGLGSRVVAVSHECDFPPEVCHKPRVTATRVAHHEASRAIDDQVREMSSAGQALYELDVPRLIELAPELIVTQAQCDVCAVRYADVLEAVAREPALAGTRVVALNPLTLEAIFDDIVRVGQAAGARAAAAEYVGRLQARVESVRKTSAALPLERRPRVVSIEWIEPVMVAANWMPELIELAGGRHELTVAGAHTGYTSWDDVRAYDPEVILIAPCGFDLPRTVVESAPLADLAGWRELAAVRTGRVYAADGNAYFNRSGPRMIESLLIVAHLLHPDRFPPPELHDDFAAIACRLEQLCR